MAHRDDLMLVVGFVIGSFRPNGPYPIMEMEGAQGTAKSTMLDKIMALGDPPADPLDIRTSPLRSERDLQIEAADVHIVCQDNMGRINAEQADWWCRLATGGSTTVRKNYSDDAKIRHRAMRPAILTCIGTPSRESDFLSRCYRVTLKPIENPLPDELVMASFLIDRPRMLGFLFRCVSAALRNRDAIAAAATSGLRLPRMAAAAAFVEGAAEIIGLKQGEFSALLADGQSVMQAEASLGDPLGAAIVRYFSDGATRDDESKVLSAAEGRLKLEGSATEILAALRGYHDDVGDWPPTNQLKERLRRIGPGLRDLGIDSDFIAAKGHINTSRYVLTRKVSFVPNGAAERS